ncbi:hypothetical protein Q7C36_000899 [Tachysurus vachellii]|uniref:Uncharacterized protein n=1 Tax=Tachysurus vachellii TaxID=175792 RepID=A0AA88T9I6_TACVA|nr:hypothetical protein Q7C36_000899 [Tachysurus vachellii]
MEGLDTIGSISAHFSPAAASYGGQLIPNFYVYEVAQIDGLVTAATQQLRSTYCMGQGSRPASIYELLARLAW